MDKPIKRDKPEFEVTWTQTITITMGICLLLWAFFLSLEDALSDAILY